MIGRSDKAKQSKQKEGKDIVLQTKCVCERVGEGERERQTESEREEPSF
jgi:hypothetical protein